MPIYEFKCSSCHLNFELLIRGKEKAACPKCETTKVEKQLSIISSPSGGTGGSSIASPADCQAPRC